MHVEALVVLGNFNRVAPAALQESHSTEYAIEVSTEGFDPIRTIVPGSYRTMDAPIVLP